jgi:hypothetical protein
VGATLHLDIGPVVFHHLAEALHSAVNVEYMRLRAVSFSPDEMIANMRDIPPLHNLFCFHLAHDTHPEAGYQLLQKLTLPGLSELHISEPSFDPNPVAAIRTLLSRSGFSFATLSIVITNGTLSESWYRRKLPSVGTITARGPDVQVLDPADDPSDSDEEDGSQNASDN